MTKVKKYYACLVPETGERLVTSEWKECEEKVSGIKDARYKSFPTRKEAEEWLAAGASYGPSRASRKKEAQKALEKGIYFDAGTGRGWGVDPHTKRALAPHERGARSGVGVEISVTDERGRNLLHKVLSEKEINKFGKHFITREATNNYGELLACRYAIQIAIDEGIKKVFGDSKLVIDYWSKWAIKKKDVAPETVALALEVSKLREEFEKQGGQVTRISGDLNPADLGFHR